MNRTSWHEIWARHALVLTERSRCDRAQIAAVIVSPQQKIISTGYNGPPARWSPPGDITDHCTDWCPRANPLGAELAGDYGDCPSLHAEINALLYADPVWRKRGTMYVTGSVCMACAKAVGNSGITTVTLVNVDEEADAHRDPDTVKAFLSACGVRVRHVMV